MRKLLFIICALLTLSGIRAQTLRGGACQLRGENYRQFIENK